MGIKKSTLDEVFNPFFDDAEEERVISLVEMNWVYDYRQRSGALTMEELEYVINKQIQRSRIEVITQSEFKVVNKAKPQSAFVASQEVVERAAEEYSKQFRKSIVSLITLNKSLEYAPSGPDVLTRAAQFRRYAALDIP